ncbi:serine/threonine-protein kinase [Stigmatella sp. ncwal1]|uniref:non-specific serine/threonine protein kinase n=1 Tax=Stigmatella ashevillensis TaxID=2995309 RepID=A0ABT5DB01_9BACT|nr:serine/threonine-protein kinase [Stigmatella ashevillena]MDC0710706.1 serine/threonine-protein kinase [Stigmatella ashevillena]
MGAWRVLEQRGQGSYGAVYRVEKVGQPEAGPFALKLALYLEDPRFEREGELLSRLQHPHVPRLLERGRWEVPGVGCFPFIAMEWVEGMPLYEWAAQHPLTSRQTLKILAQVASALAATHDADGVHRDVKGENIVVRTGDAQAVLMDFGSSYYRRARVLTHQFPPPGTPQYQSPESQRFQWECRRQPGARYEAQPSDDLYALGVTAYRLVTGRYPPAALDMKVTEEGFEFFRPPWVPPETLASVCPELSELIQQLLAEAPSARGSAEEVAEALERLAKTAGPRADRLIAPLSTQPDTAGTPWPRSSWAEAPWLAMGALVYLVLGAWWLKDGPVHPVERVQDAQSGEQRDAGTVGLGEEEILSSPALMGPNEPGSGAIGLEMPKKPLPGQRRSPCEKPMVEINEGCWGRWSDVAPPCGANSYEWKKRCYLPILEGSRPATSAPQ